MKKDILLYRIVCLATILAFCVVVLGAYTRLKDAGLGCPDWPGCYGHLSVPQGEALQLASQAFGGVKIEPHKAWPEMIHRYIAGSLGLLVLLIAIRAVVTRKRYHTPIGLPIFILCLVIFQASLGRWTVTLKLLPPIVMLHLLGGMTMVSLLLLLALRLNHTFRYVKEVDCVRFRGFALLGLLLIVIQIILGGWTSANYASLACTDFPYCSGQLIPPLHFEHAFTFMDKVGANYQGGLLDQGTRITIHFMHRFGAMIVLTYWILLCIAMFGFARSKSLFSMALLILVLLLVQVSLGVMNILLLLPLHVAVSHNAFACFLLLSIVTLNYALYPRKIGTMLNE